jgi:cellulase/cellobiase CelA1
LPCDLLKHTGCRPLACKLYARFQEYLDAAKQGGEVGRTAGVPYNFEFYVQDGEARAGAPQRLLARPRSLLPSSAPSAVDA